MKQKNSLKILFRSYVELIIKGFFLVSSAFLFGCGVKGDPVPPDVPPALGRGRPSYRDAIKSDELKNIKANLRTQEEEEDMEVQDED